MALESRPPIRAVLVDFGGVLYQTPDPRWLPKLHRLLHRLGWIDPSDNGILQMMNTSPLDSPLVMDIMTGRIPEQQVWEELARMWRISPAFLQRMRGRAYSPKRLNRALLEEITALRPEYKTALLTNAGSEFRSTFVQMYGLEAYFDKVIISAEVGLAKPDPAIFHLAAGEVGVLPEEALFVDDLPENVEGAQEAGMQALLYAGPAQTADILRQLRV